MKTDQMTSVAKLFTHARKLDDYVNGKLIWPVTLELDLTTTCNRTCPGCATIQRPAARPLDVDFIDRLLRYLSTGTKGLLLAGGEPTIASSFSWTLRRARHYGFLNLAVITNGTTLDQQSLRRSLVEYATSVRISINYLNPEDYARSFNCKPEVQNRVFRGISKLRTEVEKEGSGLRIGVAAMTDSRTIDEYDLFVTRAIEAGAHWVYFHPLCLGWESDHITQAPQTGVLEALRTLVNNRARSEISFFEERYSNTPLFFENYHAAFFLLIVCGNKKVYLSPETKYQSRYELLDLSRWDDDHFLSSSGFRNRALSFASSSYRPISNRSRGVLYSDAIQSLVAKPPRNPDSPKSCCFDGRHAHIL